MPTEKKDVFCFVNVVQCPVFRRVCLSLFFVVLLIGAVVYVLENRSQEVNALYPPSISSVLPSEGPISGGTEITINGTNFAANQFVQLTAGAITGYGLSSDGTVWSWGGNNYGQAGIGNTASPQSTPQQVTTAPSATVLTDVAQVISMYYSAYAIKSDGTVWAWGANNSSQIGNGTSSTQTRAVQVINSTNAPLTGITQLATDQSGTLIGSVVGVKNDGTVWSWGSNAYGQAGNNTMPTNQTRAVQVIDNNLQPLTGVSQVTISGGTAFAVKTDGTVWAWGNNSVGQLGNGTTTNSAVARQVLTAAASPLTGVKSITANPNSSYNSAVYALKSDGTVWSWGDNSYNRLGIIGSGNQSYAAQVVDTANNPLSDVSQVVAGAGAAMALKNDGSVWGWGGGFYGQISISNTVPVNNTPKATRSIDANGVPLSNVSQLAMNNTTTFAVKSDGTVLSWGRNDAAQLGYGSVTGPQKCNAYECALAAVPTIDASSQPLMGVQSISTNNISTSPPATFALMKDGSVWSWGPGANGQLGNGMSSGNQPYAAKTILEISPVTVTIGGAPCLDIVVVSSAQITCITPSHVAGYVDVFFTYGDGMTSTLTNGYTYYDVPSAPLNLTASRGSLTGDLVLNWLAPTTDNYSTITDYVIQYKLSSDSTWTTWTHAASTSLTATVTGLTGGSSYDFRVAAVNEAGVGPYSNIATLAASLLAIGIVDSSGAAVDSPSVPFGTVTQSSDCVQSYGSLGAASQIVRITNSTTNGNWSVSMAATGGPTAVWQRSTPTAASYTFNNPAGSGCVNGQLLVTPVTSNIIPSAGCDSTGISKGAQAAFNAGMTDSITLLTATNQSVGNCYWDVLNFSLNQAIPAGQSPGNYQIDMTLTLVAM